MASIWFMLGSVYGLIKFLVFLNGAVIFSINVETLVSGSLTLVKLCEDVNTEELTDVTASWILMCAYLRLAFESACCLWIMLNCITTLFDHLNSFQRSKSKTLSSMPWHTKMLVLCSVAGSSHVTSFTQTILVKTLPYVAHIYPWSSYMMVAGCMTILVLSYLHSKFTLSENEKVTTQSNVKIVKKSANGVPSAKTWKVANIMNRVLPVIVYMATIIANIVGITYALKQSCRDVDTTRQVVWMHSLRLVSAIPFILLTATHPTQKEFSHITWLRSLCLSVYLTAASIAPGFDYAQETVIIVFSISVLTILPFQISCHILQHYIRMSSGTTKSTGLKGFIQDAMDTAQKELTVGNMCKIALRILNFASICTAITSVCLIIVAPTVNWANMTFSFDEETTRELQPIYEFGHAIDRVVTEIDQFFNFDVLLNIIKVFSSCSAYLILLTAAIFAGPAAKFITIPAKLAKFMKKFVTKLKKSEKLLKKVKKAFEQLKKVLDTADITLAFGIVTQTESITILLILVPPVLTVLIMIFLAFWPRRFSSLFQACGAIRVFIALSMIVLTLINCAGVAFFNGVPKLVEEFVDELPLIQVKFIEDTGWIVLRLAYILALATSTILTLCFLCAVPRIPAPEPEENEAVKNIPGKRVREVVKIRNDLDQKAAEEENRDQTNAEANKLGKKRRVPSSGNISLGGWSLSILLVSIALYMSIQGASNSWITSTTELTSNLRLKLDDVNRYAISVGEDKQDKEEEAGDICDVFAFIANELLSTQLEFLLGLKLRTAIEEAEKATKKFTEVIAKPLELTGFIAWLFVLPPLLCLCILIVGAAVTVHRRFRPHHDYAQTDTKTKSESQNTSTKSTGKPSDSENTLTKSNEKSMIKNQKLTDPKLKMKSQKNNRSKSCENLESQNFQIRSDETSEEKEKKKQKGWLLLLFTKAKNMFVKIKKMIIHLLKALRDPDQGIHWIKEIAQISLLAGMGTVFSMLQTLQSVKVPLIDIHTRINAGFYISMAAQLVIIAAWLQLYVDQIAPQEYKSLKWRKDWSLKICTELFCPSWIYCLMSHKDDENVETNEDCVEEINVNETGDINQQRSSPSIKLRRLYSSIFHTQNSNTSTNITLQVEP